MYINKCSKCGAEFETKNPKRVICPACLYPDRNPLLDDSSNPEGQQQRGQQGDENQQQDNQQENNQQPMNQQGGYRSDYSQGGSYQAGGYGDRGGYNRDNRGGYGDRGGYNRDSRGGYGDRGGYSRDNRGGYGDRGGYNRDNRGGYGDRGGYQNDRGGYNRDNRGGFNRDNRGGFNRGGGRPGGRPGGRSGGFNRGGGFNNKRHAQKSLLVSREQVAQIEVLYKRMLPLPNPDAHEVIGQEIGLEPNKVFFGINLVRQKLFLPKLPFPKRKLAITPEQLNAIKSLYEPLLPLPPIGCHKILASQLKMEEWRVHVGIGLVRKQLGLERWNQDREDAPEEYKNKKEEDSTKPAKTTKAKKTKDSETEE